MRKLVVMIIPNYTSNETQRKKIIVNRLSQLNEYDFGEPHRHNYFEFFYFEKGGGTHLIDFESFEIHANSVHVVAPGSVHQVQRELSSQGFVCLFELDAVEAQREVSEFLFAHECHSVMEASPTYRFKEAQLPFIKVITQSMMDSGQDDSDLQQVSIRSLIQSLCVECMKVSDRQHDLVYQDDYARFRKLVKANFRELKKVKEYAEELCMTERTLGELVKKHTGKSPSEIIYDQIILEAKRLLLTGISAKEVAYNLNFDDPAHFSKFFKSKTGASPSEFRKVQD